MVRFKEFDNLLLFSWKRKRDLQVCFHVRKVCLILATHAVFQVANFPLSVCCYAEATTHSMQKTFQNVPLQTVFLIITKRYVEIMIASLVFDELTFSRKESLNDL